MHTAQGAKFWTFDLCYLADDTAHSPSCRVHCHHLARLRGAHLQETKVSCAPEQAVAINQYYYNYFNL